MTFYLITPPFLALLGYAVLGGAARVLALAILTIPFGMLAVIGLPAVGGLSLLAVTCTAGALSGLGFLLLLIKLLRGHSVPIEPSTIALALFVAYALFSATILVRLFAGDIMVFSLSRGVEGVRISSAFSSGKVWLAPSTSNISQSFYIVLGFGFFVTATHVLAQQGPRFGEACFAAAGTVNVALGILDALSLDGLLAIVRTANYSLLNEHAVLGLPRIIGGFPEASAFGAVSTVFFAYFTSAYIARRQPAHGWLSLTNGILAICALSAAGLLSMATVFVLLVVQLHRIGGLRPYGEHVVIFVLVFIAGILACAYLLIFTEAPSMAKQVVFRLLVEKADSSSGLERFAWAMGGLEAARDSFWLGVGVGSIRGNGLIFVLLGSLGLAGILCLAAFLWLAFGPARLPLGDKATQVLSSTRTAAVSILTAMLLTATTPDPGILLLFLAALALSAKRMPAARCRNPV